MAQRFDRVHARSAARGEVTEQHADAGRESQRQQVDKGVERVGNVHQAGQTPGRRSGNHDADHAAHRGQHHRLDQELQQHFAFQRADGQAQADLAGALGDANQHDVHDADAAHQQAHRSHGAEQSSQHLGRARQRLGQLLRVEDIEVVVVAFGEFAALAQQLRQAGLQSRTVAAVAHRHQQRGHLEAAGDAALQRAQRHHHRVVLVAHAALALGGQDADDGAREFAHAQLFAEAGLASGAVEDFAPYRFADDAHGGTGALLVRFEDAAAGELPVAGVEPRVAATDDAGGPVAAVGHHGDAGAAFGRDGRDAADLRRDGLGIAFLELRHACATAAAAARPRALAWPHHQQVGAEAGNLRLDRLGGAVTERDHRDHRADADDDAQNGEKRAQQVAADRAQRQHEDAVQHQLFSAGSTPGAAVVGCGFATSSAIRPSMKCTMRRAYAAMSASCVTISTVMPWS